MTTYPLLTVVEAMELLRVSTPYGLAKAIDVAPGTIYYTMGHGVHKQPPGLLSRAMSDRVQLLSMNEERSER